MSKSDKRLIRIRKNTKNVPLSDFEALIKDYGEIDHGGKHPKAIIGTHTMLYKKENQVKSCYVKELIDIIDSL